MPFCTSFSTMWEPFANARAPNVLQVLGILGLIVLLKVLLEFTEWLRVHYVVNSKIPRGPPIDGLLVGNLLKCTQKDFHRVHEAWSNEFGGIYHWRVLHIHVSPHDTSLLLLWLRPP